MVKVIAHRGYSEKYPENTLAAFRAALERGSDAIELDVHLTSDGELVVHHDYYLGNPDNGEGLTFKKSLSQLKSLRIGSETIPTLAEVFELVGSAMQYELELKGFTEEFLQKVIATVKKYNLAESIEFTASNPYSLSRLKELEPTWKTGIFLASFPDWMDAELGRTLAVHTAILGRAEVLHCPLSIIDEELITLAHDNNLKVHAADCNSEKDLQQAFDVGVDQLSTNALELALNLRQRS